MRFRCGFMLGDSRTTRAGFLEVADFRRPLGMLPFFPRTGDWDGSASTCCIGGGGGGGGGGGALCAMCGFDMWVRWWWASRAGEVNGLKVPGMTKSGRGRENSVSRGVTAGETKGVNMICGD